MQTSSVMRWHATACRWSFAESTHSRHDNEDRARADGVRIDCERATAAHDSRVREENLRQRALPRRSLGFDLRTHRLQFDRNQCLGGKSSVCISVLHIGANKRSLYETARHSICEFLRRRLPRHDHFVRQHLLGCWASAILLRYRSGPKNSTLVGRPIVPLGSMSSALIPPDQGPSIAL